MLMKIDELSINKIQLLLIGLSVIAIDLVGFLCFIRSRQRNKFCLYRKLPVVSDRSVSIELRLVATRQRFAAEAKLVDKVCCIDFNGAFFCGEESCSPL
ncbi:hypothetical protein E4P82_14435 [Candidatus Competibacter phosphatis]|uniref:Uncharacterized protein n=1 Tax=Candidatus Competibacter phosphatis TaxID=221280 RepID=A0ABX1TQS6_9GAMM|nr:hypothetical protein [Candidatus Competibacter phosphatis]NMQ20286.1 hypothetical protein [Candidatus Competibacter phosphatis]